ncbi:MAG: hypothetical protein ACYTXE_42400, partial [Nostoc sp.]
SVRTSGGICKLACRQVLQPIYLLRSGLIKYIPQCDMHLGDIFNFHKLFSLATICLDAACKFPILLLS